MHTVPSNTSIFYLRFIGLHLIYQGAYLCGYQSSLCIFVNLDPILSIPKSAEYCTSPVSKQG